MKNLLYNIIILSALISADCFADKNKFSTTIRGKYEAIVTKADIILADIANISSENTDAYLSLGNIRVAASPQAGKETEIRAESILQALKDNGVDLNSVGYSFYPAMSVKRAARELSAMEARSVIEDLIVNESPELKIKNIIMPQSAFIFTGPSKIKAELKNQSASSRVYTLNVSNSESENLNIDVKAEIESWKDVPVASRDLPEGSILEARDFGLARLNSSDLTKNSVININQLIGKQLQKAVNQGEAFRVNSLQKAIEVKNGSRVQMVFNSGGLLATARGIAMQDGEIGETIEVKNDSSRQIVLGKIKDKSTIEVTE